MSLSKICIIYKDFDNIKKCLKQEINKIFQETTKEVGGKIFYFSISIYKEINNEYEILYSYSVFKSTFDLIVTSENDFSGYVFSDINEGIGNKSHIYLKAFFKSKINAKLNNSSFYISKIINFDNNKYKLQIYSIYRENLSKPEKKYIEQEFESFKNNICVKCLNWYLKSNEIKLQYKNYINNLENKVVLLMDLIRNEKRKQYKYLDVLLTSKMIFELKKIAGEANFATINHTGDGFLFIYRNETDLLKNDIIQFVFKVNKFLINFKNFQKDLINLVNVYKARLIITKCDNIFEFDYIDSMDKKLYFSSDLDNVFDLGNQINYRSFELKHLNNNTNGFFLIKNDIFGDNIDELENISSIEKSNFEDEELDEKYSIFILKDN